MEQQPFGLVRITLKKAYAEREALRAVVVDITGDALLDTNPLREGDDIGKNFFGRTEFKEVLQGQQIFHRQKRYAARLERLSALAGEMAAARGRQKLVELVTARIGKDLDFTAVSFYAPEADGSLRLVAAAGEEAASDPVAALERRRWALRSATPLPAPDHPAAGARGIDGRIEVGHLEGGGLDARVRVIVAGGDEQRGVVRPEIAGAEPAVRRPSHCGGPSSRDFLKFRRSDRLQPIACR